MKPDLLPGNIRLKIVQQPGKATRRDLDAVDQLIVVLPPDTSGVRWQRLPQGKELEAAWKNVRRRSDDPAPITRLAFPGQHAVIVTLVTLKPDAPAFTRHETVRRALADVMTGDPTEIGAIPLGFDAPTSAALAEAFALCALTAAARLPKFRRKTPPAPNLKTLRLFGHGDEIDLKPLRAECDGAGLARWLGAMPPNVLSPRGYRKAVKKLADASGWGYTFYDVESLRELGAGAFLAVAQASPASDAGIVRLEYRPKNAGKKRPVALVGKGIVFDTGGVNLKPFSSMRHMHEDMLGSAVALGVLHALTQRKTPFPVDCWLAIAENHIGRDAYKPHDVVTACNGTTIEIVHTDAEGRMVLADTLALAAREKPRAILDFATLTGACVNSLSERMSGVFTNRPDWHDALIRTGRACGERVWPFPCDPDFDNDLKSPVADLLQCAVSADADHILAARFLGRFVPDRIPWLHMDLSSARHKGGLGHVATDLTGFGVRYTLALLGQDDLGLPGKKP